MQTKVTKPQLAALIELKRRGGAVISSEWTRGRGRYVSRRPVPPYCERVDRYQSALRWTPGGNRVPERIQRVFRDHPKCEAVIAIINMRSVNKTIQQAGGQS